MNWLCVNYHETYSPVAMRCYTVLEDALFNTIHEIRSQINAVHITLCLCQWMILLMEECECSFVVLVRFVYKRPALLFTHILLSSIRFPWTFKFSGIIGPAYLSEPLTWAHALLLLLGSDKKYWVSFSMASLFDLQMTLTLSIFIKPTNNVAPWNSQIIFVNLNWVFQGIVCSTRQLSTWMSFLELDVQSPTKFIDNYSRYEGEV